MWRLIRQHSNRINRGKKEKGRWAGKNGTGEGNGKFQIKVWKPSINYDDEQKVVIYMKKTLADSENIANGAVQHKIWRPIEQQPTKTVTKDRLPNKVWDPGGHRS